MKNKNKRQKSMVVYVDKLFEENSKLNCARLDFGYSTLSCTDISLEDANKHINNFLNNRRSNSTLFEHLKGYVIKIEYTKDRGFHHHGLFLFDGNKIMNGTHKGNQMGEYWSKITNGMGTYHNCNKNKYGNNGLGIIEHSDFEKRSILNKNVISYLCKDDQSINEKKTDSDVKLRSFRRGTMPKAKKKSGRPRKSS